MQHHILLGIDGGASKTAGVLLDGDGHVLARGRAGGSAVIGEPNPKSCAVLAQLVDSLCAEAGRTRHEIAHCGLGLNGIDFADQLAVQCAGICGAIGLSEARLTLVNDGIVALWGASPERAALIIQHGSGFTAAYRSDYGREQLFDHLSVAHVSDMRYGLTTLVARMIHGMVPATPLKEATLAAYGVTESDYCEAIYRHRIPGERLRNTVPMIFEAWQRGDPAAAELVEAAIAEDTVAACAMIAKTGSDRPAVTLGGGQLRAAPEEFWRLLTARIRAHYPYVTVSGPRLVPELGAALMAAFRVGVDAEALFSAVERQGPA